MSDISESKLYAILDQRRAEEIQEHRLVHERISNLKDELLAELKEMRKEQAHINKELEKRVTALERWKWTFMGGGAVLMFFLLNSQSFLQIFFQ